MTRIDIKENIPIYDITSRLIIQSVNISPTDSRLRPVYIEAVTETNMNYVNSCSSGPTLSTIRLSTETLDSLGWDIGAIVKNMVLQYKNEQSPTYLDITLTPISDEKDNAFDIELREESLLKFPKPGEHARAKFSTGRSLEQIGKTESHYTISVILSEDGYANLLVARNQQEANQKLEYKLGMKLVNP